MFQRANSVDIDEEDHYEPPHLDLCCLQIGLFIYGKQAIVECVKVFICIFSLFLHKYHLFKNLIKIASLKKQ